MFRPTIFPDLLLLLWVCCCGTTLSQATGTGSFESTVPVSSSTASITLTGADGNRTISGGSSCPLRYHDCAVIGQPNICCTLDQVCINDGSGKPACCPFRTKCVGSVGSVPSSGPANAGLMFGLNALLAAGAAVVYLVRVYPL
ncbi:hypothetical protein L873DRAFT_1672928 [Choiromyces venosus 120613-1]|uniref:Hydrophobin n=1 Tax=Choiromyces venosus 120613-1 TaxID=1336337 RepID=A0A3N4JVW6_9PEZI|nr:hypothetical protein L873DRAFT_1672928 [Choiromyces venosus 120613-1]